MSPELTESVSRTKVFKVREGSDSLKGTIPNDVVSALKLKDGDEIEWEIEVIGGAIAVVARKARAER